MMVKKSVEEHSIREIAEVLGISYTECKKAFDSGMEKIAKYLNKRDIEDYL